MKIYNYLIFCFLIASFFNCQTATESKDGQVKTKIKREVSDSYQPPAFEDDRRAEKIRSIAAEVHQLMEKHALSMHLPGVAYGIVVDNQLVIASAIGQINLDKKLPTSTNSAFRIASMTKSFTAMAILKLREEGKLSLEDPAEKYIPEMAGLEYPTNDSPIIDIENLLTMTAGFPEDNPWGDRQLDELDEMLLELMQTGVSFSNPPSYTFEYSNTGYALLGNIISRVSGMPYQQYITKNILRPLGMEHTYWEIDSIQEDRLAIGYRWENEQWQLEPMLHDGSYGAMGGLITTIEDFSKYVSYHLSAWPPRSDGEKGPVRRNTLREMQTPQFASLYGDEDCQVVGGYGYGLGVSTDCKDLKQVRHGGALPGFGSSYVFFPDYGVGIMAFCNLTYTSAMPTEEIKKLLFDELDLQPRKLPVSNILAKRQKQIVELVQHWTPELEEEILAENFYLDQSREIRISEIEQVLKKAGEFKSIGELDPFNQLRGSFGYICQNDTVNIFFTLTLEKDPKVQYLDVWLEDN